MFKVSDLLFGAAPVPPTLSSGVVVVTVAVLSSVRAAAPACQFGRTTTVTVRVEPLATEAAHEHVTVGAPLV